MEEMSSCDHTYCECIEDDYDEHERHSSGDDNSSGDEPESLPHQFQPLTQCNASVLCSLYSAADTTPLPPVTSRVLGHPTFEAYYAAVAIHQNLETPAMQRRREEGFTANPGEYYYTDPLLSPGHRVYNCLSPASHNVFGCFRLQAPPPIMSSCIFPSTYDDDPMGEEEEDLGDPLHNDGWMDLPPVETSCAPLDMIASQCLLPPVLGCSVLVSADPYPVLYTTSELDAVCALLCLSSGAPHCAH